MKIQEIIYNRKTSKKYKSADEHTKEYCKHIGYGASGSYDSKTKLGTISSHLEECKKLEKAGYKNLHFCNGGDDDILIVDHDRKEFGFLEYGDPMKIGMEICP